MPTSLTPFPYTFSAVTNVAPLTYRDASTFLEELESLKQWLNSVQVPEINTVLDSILADAQAGVTNAEETVVAAQAGWQAAFTAFMADVAVNIGIINNAVIDGRITGKLDTTVAAATYETKTHADTTFEKKKVDPLAYWKNAVQDQDVKTAVYVNLGDSIANGGTPTQGNRAWVNRVSALYTNRTPYRLDAATLSLPPATGVQFYNGAVGGKTSTNYLTDDLVNRIGTIEPQLATHMVGANDQGAGMVPAVFRDNIQNWVIKIRAASPNTVNVIVIEHKRPDLVSPLYPWSAYREEMLDLAAEMSLPVLDMETIFRTHGLGDRYKLMHPDNLHFADDGNRVYAKFIAEFMGAPTPNYFPREIESPAGAYNYGTFTVVTSVNYITVAPKPYIREGVFTVSLYANVTGKCDLNLRLTPTGEARIDLHSHRMVAGIQVSHTAATKFALEPNKEYTFYCDLGPYTDATVAVDGNEYFMQMFADMSPA